jgi:hypothetical protein
LEQKTTVVNVKLAPYDVYIGRANRSYGLAASPFGNPFIPGRDGTPQECLALYREHVTSTPALMRLLPSLKGKRLGCWCKKTGSEPCHGDVLVELIEEKPNDI